MQASIFISKYLVVFGCLISLSSFGQSIENKNVNSISVVKDTVNRRNSKQVDDMISYAKKFLGTPYRYAGTTPSGFDCSGFINYVMGNFGFDLVRSSYGLAELGETVRLAEIQPGD